MGIILSHTPDSVDAVLTTKDRAFRSICDTWGVDPARCAAIGDGINDIPFLSLAGFVGCPANACDAVKDVVRQRGGYIAQRPYSQGFLAFYYWAMDNGAELVVSDRDGVVRNLHDSVADESLFSRFIQHVGSDGYPHVVFLTGSSVDQNLEWMREGMHGHSLIPGLSKNVHYPSDKPMYYVENGSVTLDPVTGKYDIDFSTLSMDDLLFLKDTFLPTFLRRLAQEVLPVYDFGLAGAERDAGRVFLPPKIGMVTVDVPYVDKRGELFRGTTAAEDYKASVLALMETVLKEYAHPYEVLETSLALSAAA